MIRLIAIFAALTCAASAQTYRTVTADTNNAIRTNFTITVGQLGAIAISDITGLQSNLNEKLEIADLAPSGVLFNDSSLNQFPAGLLRTNGSAAGLTNFPAANLSNVSGVLSLAAGGTGATNATAAIASLLPAYSNNAGKVLGLDTNLSLVWTTNAGGGGSGSVTNIDASGGSTGLTFSGGPITNGGTLTLGGTLNLANGGTGATNASGARTALELGSAATNNASAFQPSSLALSNLANGDASGLTNIPNASLSTPTGTLPLSNGGSGATNAATARTNFGLVWSGLTNVDDAGFRAALSLGTAATNPATAFQAASTNLDALANNNGGNLTNVGVDLTAVLPSYSNNAGKVLAVATGATNVEWTAISNTVTDASQLTNFPASILQSGSAETNFPAFLLRTNGSAAGLTSFPLSLLTTNGSAEGLTNFPALVLTTNSSETLFPAQLLRTNGSAAGLTGFPASLLTTNGSAAGLTNFPTLNQNTTGTASNVTGVVAVANGGTGASGASNARVNLLPSYSGNQSKVLALNSNATDVEWVAQSGGGGGSGTVTSVAMTVPTFLSVSGSPITTNGTLAVTLSGTALPLANGGTGGTNATAALTSLGILSGSSSVGIGSPASGTNQVIIGISTSAGRGGVSIGFDADANAPGAILIGDSAKVTGSGATNSIAIGSNAIVFAGNNSVQLGNGSNNGTRTIQFLSAGQVDTNKWAALANVSSIGTNVMRTTNATWLTNTTASGFRSDIGLPLSALTNTSNTDFQGAVFSATTTNAPTNTNAPTPDAWLDIRVGTNDYKLPLWQ